MAIIKQYHKDTDTTYVYESTSYWDAEKQQSRSKRKLLGKVDPVTGEIIPTGTRGRKKKETPDTSAAETETLQDEKNLLIQELTISLSQKNQQISALELENQKLRNALAKIQNSLGICLDLCSSVSERQ